MGISILAALISVWQTIIAKKSLILAKNQEELQKPSIELSIINSSQLKEQENTYYIIDCALLNKSRTEDSISSVGFIIKYRSEKSLILHYKCDHEKVIENEIGIEFDNVSEVPIHLSGNDISKSTFLFKVDNNVFKGCSIIEYYLEASSITGKKLYQNISLIPFLDK